MTCLYIIFMHEIMPCAIHCKDILNADSVCVENVLLDDTGILASKLFRRCEVYLLADIHVTFDFRQAVTLLTLTWIYE